MPHENVPDELPDESDLPEPADDDYTDAPPEVPTQDSEVSA
jgi:hypothetical protein